MAKDIDDAISVHLTAKGPLALCCFHEPLFLKSAPVYLRFVIRGTNTETLDALDQPEDAPTPSERVIPAKRKGGIDKVFFSGSGKAAGIGFLACYDELNVKVPDECLYDTALWNGWVERQMKRDATYGGINA